MPEEGFSEELTLTNRFGLHLRPSSLFVEEANRYRAQVFVSVNGGEEGNGKSIFDLLARAAEKGATIRIRTMGEDAPDALEGLAALVRHGFDDFRRE